MYKKTVLKLVKYDVERVYFGKEEIIQLHNKNDATTLITMGGAI